MAYPRMTAERFFARVTRGEGDACWTWNGSRNSCGYGKLTFRGGTWAAHRAVLVLTGVTIEPGMHVCHHCDNPICVRPDHLFIGTNDDNVRDKMAKGRHSGWRLTACPAGHDYTPENSYYSPRGHRRCRECRRVKYRQEHGLPLDYSRKAA